MDDETRPPQRTQLQLTVVRLWPRTFALMPPKASSEATHAAEPASAALSSALARFWPFTGANIRSKACLVPQHTLGSTAWHMLQSPSKLTHLLCQYRADSINCQQQGDTFCRASTCGAYKRLATVLSNTKSRREYATQGCWCRPGTRVVSARHSLCARV